MPNLRSESLNNLFVNSWLNIPKCVCLGELTLNLPDCKEIVSLPQLKPKPVLNFISTMTSIRQLVEVSRFYGKDKSFVMASGGNTSYKDGKFMWIKATGTSLGNITEEDFVILDREKLKIVETKKYSEYASEREKQIRNDLFRACVYPERNLRPSVETSLHEIINYNYVVHTHPTLVNALMCSNEAEQRTNLLFGDKVLYIPYTNPGYMLFKKVKAEIAGYRDKFQTDPHIILLQNHGVIVAADTTDEIKSLHQWLISALSGEIPEMPDVTPLPVEERITKILPAIRLMLTDREPVTAIIRHHRLLQHFYSNADDIRNIETPLTPDVILYCNTRIIYIEDASSVESLLREAADKIETFKRTRRYTPKILILKDIGIVSADVTFKAAELAMNVFEDQMKISLLARSFGGAQCMAQDAISFIDNQTIDNVKMLLNQKGKANGRVFGKTIIITDVSDIPGRLIADDLMQENANLVVACTDETAGNEYTTLLNSKAKDNLAVFVKTDFSRASDVNALLYETVRNFGGLDALLMVNNGIEEQYPASTSEFVTRQTAEILKLQAIYKRGYFTDILKVNPQPLPEKGAQPSPESNLPDVAKALYPFCIKVNTINPGIFLSSSVWSHPDSGMLRNWLNANKVPGAQTIDHVKGYMEERIPAARGCEIRDLMRAVYYLLEQEYETGQTVRVSGGLV